MLQRGRDLGMENPRNYLKGTFRGSFLVPMQKIEHIGACSSQTQIGWRRNFNLLPFQAVAIVASNHCTVRT